MKRGMHDAAQTAEVLSRSCSRGLSRRLNTRPETAAPLLEKMESVGAHVSTNDPLLMPDGSSSNPTHQSFLPSCRRALTPAASAPGMGCNSELGRA